MLSPLISFYVNRVALMPQIICENRVCEMPKFIALFTLSQTMFTITNWLTFKRFYFAYKRKIMKAKNS